MRSITNKHINPLTIIAIIFMFTIVFSWLYIYAPMLLGLKSLDEAMTIIVSNRRALFSLISLANNTLAFLPAVILCAVYSFFFLDIRRYIPLMLVTLVTPGFLASLATLSIVQIEFHEFNSLFVFTQFFTLSIPFVVLDRYSESGLKSWKEYFKERIDFSKRIRVMKKSSKAFAKELLIVAILVGIGKVPSFFTEAFSHDFFAAYFIETGIVFFFSFFVTGGILLLFGTEEKRKLFSLFTITLVILVALFLIMFIPFLIGLIMSPFFGIEGVRATIAHTPGTTYFLTFYSFLTFLHSGHWGIVSLIVFLISIIYVTIDSLQDLDLPRISYSPLVLSVMIVVITGFVFIFYPGIQSRPKTILIHKEILRIEAPASNVFPFEDRLLILDGIRRKISIFERSKQKKVDEYTMDYKEARYISILSDITFAANKSSIAIGSIIKGRRKNQYRAAFSIIDKDRKKMKNLSFPVNKKTSMKLLVAIGNDFIALVNDRSERKLSAYSIAKAKKIWDSDELGSSGGSFYFMRDQIVYKIRKGGSLFLDMPSLDTVIGSYNIASGSLIFFETSSGKYKVVNLKNGEVQKSGRKICDLAANACFGQKKSILRTFYSGGIKNRDKLPCMMGYGFLWDGESIFCADKKRLLGIDDANGNGLWELSLADATRYKKRFYHYINNLLLVKDYSTRGIVTAMVIDKKKGAIIGRWSVNRSELRDCIIYEDGTIFMVLQSKDRKKKDVIVGITFQ